MDSRPMHSAMIAICGHFPWQQAGEEKYLQNRLPKGARKDAIGCKRSGVNICIKYWQIYLLGRLIGDNVQYFGL